MNDALELSNIVQHPISFCVGTVLIRNYPEHKKYIKELIEKFDKTLEIEYGDRFVLKINGVDLDFGEINDHKIEEKDGFTFEREYSLKIARLYDDLPNTWDYAIYTSYVKIIVLSFYNFIVSHFNAGGNLRNLM